MAARGNIPSQAPGMMRHGPVPPLGPASLGPSIRHPMEPPLPPPELLENKLMSQGVEMDMLLSENKRLAATHGSLRQELIAAQQEMQRIHAHSGRIQTENDIQIRSLQDKILKLEADIKLGESIRKELQQAHLEAQGLVAARQELTVQILQDTEELKKLHSDLKKFPEMHAELDGLMQEHQKLRSTFEHEKGANMELVQQMHVMEKNLITMAREVEKLRAEVQSAEKKANAPNPYQSQYGSPDPVNPSPAQGASQYGGGGYSQGGGYGGSAYSHYNNSAYAQGMSANYDPYTRAQGQAAGAAGVGEGTNPYAGTAPAGAYDPNRSASAGGYDTARAAYEGQRGAVAASGSYEAARGAVTGGAYDAARGPGVYDAGRGAMVPGGYDAGRGAAPTGGYDAARAAAATGGYDHARMASAAGGHEAARAAAASGGYDAVRMAGGGSVANAYDGSRAGENMAGMYEGMRAPVGAYGMYDPARSVQQQSGPR